LNTVNNYVLELESRLRALHTPNILLRRSNIGVIYISLVKNKKQPIDGIGCFSYVLISIIY